MSRRVWCYLATGDANNDELAYRAYAGTFDVLMPLHGGKVEPDGSWTQEPWKLNTAFALALPREARAQGQVYAPVVNESDDTDGWNTFLDSPHLWRAAVDGFLAMYDARFDKPWHGVVFNFETTTSDRRDKLTDWIAVLARAVRSLGLDVYIHTHGRTEATDNWYDSAYAFDHAALGQIADRLIYDISGYWLPLPRSMAPHWYVINSLHYVVGLCRVPAPRVIANIGSYSKLIGPGGGGSGTLYSHSDALALIGDNPARWIEANVNGILRQHRAILEDRGTMWLMNGRWVRERLPLVNRWGIDNLAIFRPAGTAPDLWPVLTAWKRPRRVDRYQGQGMKSSAGSKGGYLCPRGR